jgi:hypothetical protein
MRTPSSIALLSLLLGASLALVPACSDDDSTGESVSSTGSSSNDDTSSGSGEAEGSDESTATDDASESSDDGSSSSDDGSATSSGDTPEEEIIGATGSDSSDPPDAGVADPTSATGSVDESLPLPSGITVNETEDGDIEFLCGDSICACSDGEDNDGDGTLDGNDSECTGPFDDDEGTFATGISGDNKDGKWQDCFFDGNSGAGEDGCRYHTDCLTGDLPADDPDCRVTEQCKEFCEPLSPPGCDCFGCCEVQTDDGEMVSIIVSDSCSIEQIDDEKACPRCKPTTICENECGECEICLGMTYDDLPDSCKPNDTPPDNPPDGPGDGGTPDDGAGGSPGDTPDDPGTPDDPDSPPTGSDGGTDDTPDSPPSNICDNGAVACFDDDGCEVGQYCTLGCCRSPFRVR